MRHEDVHGVSGTGKVADVFEATNGKCIVVWISPHSSTNIYDNVKHVESTHSHGGKSLVVWDYESPADPDPMDALKDDDTPKVELNDEELAEIAEEAAEGAKQKIAKKIVEKLTEASEPEPEAASSRVSAAASKVLRNPKTSKAAKTAAGKALTQKADKKKTK
ncbi:hypothetical protein LCGC14_1728080 [marine sediment metagenome]|uniref:Uncharacterized protein n=1 Tax=marine sediment metagenome TaxID=412755 RepID=A0A0F9JQX6_9ZZZZ